MRARAVYPRVALAAAALGLCACATEPRCTVAIGPRARGRFEEARRLEEAGRISEAATLYREVVEAEPRFVAAHRALQNLGLAQHRRGELLVSYRELLDEDPRSPERWYLWGRVQTSAREQRRAFEAARRLDERCPWPWLGLGALDLAAGNSRAAVEALEKGRELAPDLRELELAYLRALIADPPHEAAAERLLTGVLDAEPWDAARVLLFAELRVAQERPREAIEILGRLLARLPGNAEVAARLLERLERDGTVEDAAWLERELSASGNEALVRRLLARCHAMRGDAEGAIAAWNSLPELSAEERAWRRLLRVLRGDLRGAVDEERPRYRALAALGARFPAWEELAGLQSGRGSDGEGEPVPVAVALSRMGWVDEAIALLRPLAHRSDAPEPAQKLLGRLLAQRQLEAELKVLALETYRGFSAGRRPLDFEAFRERMGAAARRVLGDDLLDSTQTMSFWPIGAMLDPASPGGLPGWFRQCGRLLVAGQRRGRPPELLLASVIASGTAGPQRAQLSFIEGTLIPGWLEHEGARFAGAALDRFVYVDVAAVEDELERILALERRLGEERGRLLRDPALPAKDRRERRSVAEPAEVATKLELRALDDWRARDPSRDPAGLLAEALDGVLAHEIAHLEDAARFLPVSKSLWRHLATWFGLGFSPRRIEEWLEMRAECVALARARNPRLVLGACIGQATGGGSLTPHGGGYVELLERLVVVVDESPQDFPALDRSRNLLQQLDLLSRDEIRLAATRVLSDLGIDESR